MPKIAMCNVISSTFMRFILGSVAGQTCGSALRTKTKQMSMPKWFDMQETITCIAAQQAILFFIDLFDLQVHNKKLTFVLGDEAPVSMCRISKHMDRAATRPPKMILMLYTEVHENNLMIPLQFPSHNRNSFSACDSLTF